MAKKQNKAQNQNKNGTSKIPKVILVSLIILLLFVLFFKQFKKQIVTIGRQEKEKTYYSNEIKRLEKENKQLKQKAEKINSDEYIEEMARKKLNMYYKNERVYIDANSIK